MIIISIVAVVIELLVMLAFVFILLLL